MVAFDFYSDSNNKAIRATKELQDQLTKYNDIKIQGSRAVDDYLSSISDGKKPPDGEGLSDIVEQQTKLTSAQLQLIKNTGHKGINIVSQDSKLSGVEDIKSDDESRDASNNIYDNDQPILQDRNSNTNDDEHDDKYHDDKYHDDEDHDDEDHDVEDHDDDIKLSPQKYVDNAIEGRHALHDAISKINKHKADEEDAITQRKSSRFQSAIFGLILLIIFVMIARVYLTQSSDIIETTILIVGISLILYIVYEYLAKKWRGHRRIL